MRIALAVVACAGCADVFSVDRIPEAPPDMVCGVELCIDRTEVTTTGYAAFLDAVRGAPSDVREECRGYVDFMPARSWPPPPGDELPITNVSWCDAAAFCAWAGKRLCGRRERGGGPVAPTDNTTIDKDEWTYACTGGDRARVYPYGESYVADLCNDSRPSGPLRGVLDNTACEGGLPGLLDMSGNAWEWEDSCASPALDSNCYIRGGAFNELESHVTCGTAVSQPHPRNDKAYSTIGFRCCADR